jgi:hypothetical protein
MNKNQAREFRNYFLKPYAQIRIGIYFLIASIFFVSIVIAVSVFYLADIFASLQAVYALTEQEGLQVWEKFTVPLSILVMLGIGFIVSILFLSARLTHRIYGPAHSMERFLEDLLNDKSEIEPLRIREGDEFQHLVMQLNLLKERLSAGKEK